jgi:Carbon monoxide dehydrogenase subunit G (CoxG)
VVNSAQLFLSDEDNLHAHFAPIQRHLHKRDGPMAMTMTGEVQLPANREAAWAMLNEPTVLKSCIPGCESLDKDSNTEFRAVATIKFGPVKTRWKGKVRFSDLDPPKAIASPAKAASPALPRAAPGSRSPTRMAARC